MKLISTFLILTLLPFGVNAAGEHAGGHGHDDGHGMHEYSVGEPAEGKPDRIFRVSLRDTMRFVFEPEFEDLHAGEVIRFELRNDGAIIHEFSIGNAADQVAHAKMMREMPGMVHEDPNTVSLQPGERGSITWRFAGEDTVVFACNVPGHFEAGMRHGLPIKGPGHAH